MFEISKKRNTPSEGLCGHCRAIRKKKNRKIKSINQIPMIYFYNFVMNLYL